MLFGRGNPKAEETSVEQVMPLLNQLFQQKIIKLDAQAARTVKNIEPAKEAFLSACDDFEKLQAEPDTENLFTTKTTYLKDLKSSYITALKRIVSASEMPEDEGETKFHLYRAQLAELQRFINEILRTNKTFKPVLDTYSTHLARFKLTFTNLERLTSELNTELAFHLGDFNRYEELRSKIEALAASLSEQQSVRNELNGVQGKSEADSSRYSLRKEALKAEIAQRSAEIGGTNEKIANARNQISLSLSSIEKAARKHDHLSLSKTKLSTYIENPQMITTSDDNYSDFISQLQSLRKDFEMDKVSVKNKEEVERSLQFMLTGAIKEAAAKTKELEEVLLPARNEIRAMENELRDIEALERAESDRTSKASYLESMIKDLNAECASLKTEIERMFVEYYKKKILIKI